MDYLDLLDEDEDEKIEFFQYDSLIDKLIDERISYMNKHNIKIREIKNDEHISKN